MIEITIVNASSILGDDMIAACVPAIEAQANEDVCPAWRIEPVKLTFAGKTAPDGSWPLYVMDHSDDPGALGYHLDSQGRIEGKVFAADCLRYGASWTVDLTHELIEMLGDPLTTTTMPLPDGRVTIRELCDAVEDESVAYLKRGVLVTDFVLPAYFQPGSTGPWDFEGHLKGPAPTLTAGGYLSIYDAGLRQWTQITARHRDGSIARRARRVGRSHWRAARKTA